MELDDCAFPLLQGLVLTGDPKVAFADADWAILVGAKPRGPGMERADLLKDNGRIFVEQGKAIDEVASADARVVVVGNPCNTNCMIAASQATRLGPERFTAMTRLDQNRAQTQLAQKAGVRGDRGRATSSSSATTRRRCSPTSPTPRSGQAGRARSSATTPGSRASSCPRSASAARRSSPPAACRRPPRRPTRRIDHVRSLHTPGDDDPLGRRPLGRRLRLRRGRLGLGAGAHHGAGHLRGGARGLRARRVREVARSPRPTPSWSRSATTVKRDAGLNALRARGATPGGVAPRRIARSNGGDGRVDDGWGGGSRCARSSSRVRPWPRPRH